MIKEILVIGWFFLMVWIVYTIGIYEIKQVKNRENDEKMLEKYGKM